MRRYPTTSGTGADETAVAMVSQAAYRDEKLQFDCHEEGEMPWFAEKIASCLFLAMYVVGMALRGTSGCCRRMGFPLSHGLRQDSSLLPFSQT